MTQTLKSKAARSGRREFLVGSAGLALAGMAIAAERAQGANERIRIGVIGCGGRGNYHIDEILKNADTWNASLVALCDVWSVNLKATAAKIQAKSGQAPFQTSKYEELLSRSDVDAVIITTPDHAHCPILAASARAGKHAFCEKPMADTLENAILAYDAVKASKVTVQIGTQRRSEGAHQAAARLIQSGALGTITAIDTAWHDSSPRWARPFDDVLEADVDWEQYQMGLPQRPFDPRRFRCWHLFRDYTCGLPGLLGSHLVDVALWYMEDPFPKYGTAIGGNLAWKDGREHCDTIECLWEFPKGFLLRYSSRLGNAFPVPEVVVYGAKGTFDTASWKAVPNGGGKEKLSAPIEVKADPNVSHMGNFLDCVRSGKQPHAPVETGYAHSVVSILASQAQLRGKQLSYDAVKRAFVEL